MTENRFVLLVFVSVQEIVIFNCYDRAGFPDMNYETLDQILWKCPHVVPNSSWYIHWRRLKLSNRHLNIYGLYKEACEEKKTPWNQQSHIYLIYCTFTWSKGVLNVNTRNQQVWYCRHQNEFKKKVIFLLSWL